MICQQAVVVQCSRLQRVSRLTRYVLVLVQKGAGTEKDMPVLQAGKVMCAHVRLAVVRVQGSPTVGKGG